MTMTGQNQSAETYDAIVVGSGITGGWAAKELTEKGLRVLMLDRGSPQEHPNAYRGEHAPNWTLPFGGLPNRSSNAEEYEVQSRCYAFEEATRELFVRDSDEPYIQEEGTDYEWIRGSRFGGRSLIWGRQVYRWGPQDFEANALDGHGTDWPLRYDDLKDWYSHVEAFIGVSGQAEGLDSFPDSEFLAPMEMNAIEKTIKGRLARKEPGLTHTIGRVAILSEDHNGRSACHYCGPCPRGCSPGSYFSTQSSTLPAAEKTGRLTALPNRAVQKVLFDSERNRATGVEVLNVETRQQETYQARIIFMCASAIHSAQILLNSKSEAFPEGIANSSGVIGHYLMDHQSHNSGIGVFFDNLDRYYYGFRPNGTYIPRFRNLNGQDPDADFIRGYGFQCGSIRLDYRFNMHQTGIGATYKETLRKPGPWAFSMEGFAEFLPHWDNKVTLDETRRDAFGMPLVRIAIRESENDIRMRADMKKQADRILKAAGAVVTLLDDEKPAPINAIHEMGTVRMGRDPKTSALNGWNQAHDVPNLFVTDGAAMASSAYVNPSLTYMAFTARAADHAAALWKRGEL